MLIKPATGLIDLNIFVTLFYSKKFLNSDSHQSEEGKFSCFSSNRTRYLIFFVLKGDVLEIGHFYIALRRCLNWYKL